MVELPVVVATVVVVVVAAVVVVVVSVVGVAVVVVVVRVVIVAVVVVVIVCVVAVGVVVVVVVTAQNVMSVSQPPAWKSGQQSPWSAHSASHEHSSFPKFLAAHMFKNTPAVRHARGLQCGLQDDSGSRVVQVVVVVVVVVVLVVVLVGATVVVGRHGWAQRGTDASNFAYASYTRCDCVLATKVVASSTAVVLRLHLPFC